MVPCVRMYLMNDSYVIKSTFVCKPVRNIDEDQQILCELDALCIFATIIETEGLAPRSMSAAGRETRRTINKSLFLKCASMVVDVQPPSDNRCCSSSFAKQ